MAGSGKDGRQRPKGKESTLGKPASGRPPRRLAGARRLPLRTVLLIIVFVPSLTFTPLLASGMFQLSSQWREEKAQLDLATTTVGGPAADLFLDLDQERRLTAELQATPGAAARDRLAKQRAETDKAVAAFRPLVDVDTTNGQEGITEAVVRTDRLLGSLDEQRRAVDAGRSSDQRAFDYYSGVLESDLNVLTVLSQTDEGQVNSLSRTLIDLFWVVDTIGREDALLARGWESGRLTRAEQALVADAIGTRKHLLRARVIPSLTDDEVRYRTMTTGKSWQAMTALEERLTAPASAEATLRGGSAEWRAAADAVKAQILELLRLRLQIVNEIGYDHAGLLFTLFVSISTVGLLALGLVIFTSWRLTSILRRRILHLREEAHELQERLPKVVARLERGEDVDVDAEVRMVKPTPDELGELGHALNLARRSAVHTAVRQAEQHRGFQRMLQRIARRTQILIGLQLKKLDELERKHEDPEVLEGLFDLDHLTARLRRYEENLVILGGGQPQRRWRKPVQLLDVLRAAQGEVQDYRRISVDVEGESWVAERAVGPLVHVLAELMENATTFSKPKTPVEVRAAAVSRGVAVEIEDRGLGMEAEQYAAANALMKSPPRLDVMTHADDVRLGLYVVARLSASLGLQVELRSSAFGGTRVVVLIPEALVVERPAAVPAAKPATRSEEDPAEVTGPIPVVPAEPTESAVRREEEPTRDGRLPSRTRGRAMAHVTAPAAPAGQAPAPAGQDEGLSRAGQDEGPAPAGRPPLPQRVRQASLVTELLTPAGDEPPAEPPAWTERERPARSGATIGAFQRQSRKRRTTDEDQRRPAHEPTDAATSDKPASDEPASPEPASSEPTPSPTTEER